MKNFLFIICMIFVFGACIKTDKTYDLQTGDLLFSVGKGNSGLLSAIQNTTSKDKEIPFSHVGIVAIEEDEIFVLEATPSAGVVKTKLEDFFDETATYEGKKLIAVGRVKDEFQYIIPDAIKNAEKHLGKKYDFAYDESNNALYCSELVRFAFLDSLENPIFEPLAMSFRNIETGVVDEYWVNHFENLGTAIPEGQPGTNPADMTKSPVIKIVHKYY